MPWRSLAAITVTSDDDGSLLRTGSRRECEIAEDYSANARAPRRTESRVFSRLRRDAAATGDSGGGGDGRVVATRMV